PNHLSRSVSAVAPVSSAYTVEDITTTTTRAARVARRRGTILGIPLPPSRRGSVLSKSSVRKRRGLVNRPCMGSSHASRPTPQASSLHRHMHRQVLVDGRVGAHVAQLPAH